MADKQSAVAKLMEKRAKEMKEYKSSHDVERVFHLISAASLIKDWPMASALAASLMRELMALNAKQAELDAKEREEQNKEAAEAVAADAKEQASEPKSGEEDHPSRAASSRSR